MQFPKNIFNNRMLFNMLIMTFLVAGSMTAAFGQRSISFDQKDSLAAGASVEHCRNGADGSFGCAGASANLGWGNGNAGDSNSDWYEDDFVPYRMLFSGLEINSENYVIIGYDRLHEQGNQTFHAFDYLGSYFLSEPGTDPCFGVTFDGGTVNCAAPATAPVPDAPAGDLINNQGETIDQIPGVFSFFGATFDGVPHYVDCPQVNDTLRCVRIDFIPTVTNPVLAWGGHVAWREDWGEGQSAGGLSGSPYHGRLISLNGSGGSQDRSMSASAISAPGTITIIKQTVLGVPIPVDVDFEFYSPEFAFVVDGEASVDGVFFLNTSQAATTTTETMTVRGFQLSNPFTVTEDMGGTGNWALSGDLSACVEVGDPQYPGNIDDNSIYNGAFGFDITVERGESVTCTFVNVFTGTTAALASVTGRVTNATGIGISGATMTLVNAGTGQSVRAITNPFGYYTFENLEVEELYILSVGHKRYNFLDGQRVFTLDGDLVGVDFTSMW